MIRPQLEDRDIFAIKQQSHAPTSTRGDVRSTGGHLIFEVEPAFEQRLEADLRNFFSKKVSALLSARVVPRETTPSRSRSLSLSLEGELVA